MSRQNPKNNTVSARIDIIQTVKTPLGFFTLVVLVVEVILGVTANFSQGTDRTYLIVGMLSLIFLLVVIVSGLAVFRPEALSGKRPPPPTKLRAQYGIKIDTSINNQSFRGGIGNLEIDVSGIYKVKPPPETLRIFTKTFNPDVFWRQDPRSLYFDDKGKRWHGKVSLWKEIGWSPYSAYIIATVLDEAGKEIVLHADKVQRETGKNVEFDKLPSYIEKCDDEIKVNRE